MKIRGTIAVMVLCAASMMAQSAAPAPDAAKPADHAACARNKDGKMDSKMECCKKDKDGKMSKEMDCCKKGKCAHDKNSSEKKS